MPLYLFVKQGDSADQAETLFATGDEKIIAGVAKELAVRCGVQLPRQIVPLNSKPQTTKGSPVDES